MLRPNALFIYWFVWFGLYLCIFHNQLINWGGDETLKREMRLKKFYLDSDMEPWNGESDSTLKRGLGPWAERMIKFRVRAWGRVLDTSCKTMSCGPLRDRSLRFGHFVISHFVIGHFVRSLREVNFVIGHFVEVTSWWRKGKKATKSS